MDMDKYQLRIDFVTELLGTQPQKDIATTYLAGKVAATEGGLPEDEMGTLPEELKKGTTAFHKLQDGTPIFYDYMIKGFLKEAGGIFNGLRNVKNLRSKVDNLVFVTPRQIVIHLPPGAIIDFLERPLRAMTAQGPRTGIARSEMIPAGSWMEFGLEVYESAITGPLIHDLLTYGEKKGLGQWRNGGHGSFTFNIEHVSGPARWLRKSADATEE